MLMGDDPSLRFHALAIIVVVMISIVLHELAHGWMAIRLGDNTPRRLQRMTGNPLVHMGPFSLLALALFGIAWGQMPIDPTRLKGKYGGLKVALAGPAMNVLLAVLGVIGLTVLTLVQPATTASSPPLSPVWENASTLLFTLSFYNLLLAMFNLMPIPPLDGSHVLADLNASYARAVENPGLQGVWLMSFFFVFMFAGAF